MIHRNLRRTSIKLKTCLNNVCYHHRQHCQRKAKNVEQRQRDECFLGVENVVTRWENIDGKCCQWHLTPQHNTDKYSETTVSHQRSSSLLLYPIRVRPLYHGIVTECMEWKSKFYYVIHYIHYKSLTCLPATLRRPEMTLQVTTQDLTVPHLMCRWIEGTTTTPGAVTWCFLWLWHRIQNSRLTYLLPWLVQFLTGCEHKQH